MKPRVLHSKYINFLKTTQFKATDFTPQFINEKWCKPKYSLREQADLRKACHLLGMNPSDLGLPVKQNKEVRVTPEGTKYQKNYLDRKLKTDTAVDNMDKTVNKWKQEKEKESAGKISNLPF
ncbi:hypothetical protein K502DRAFT_363453 [Neoconidiobolus thromboides FSU 785]|nr:hypothetical protein K502DRAFT_363453 [Neoconidiobolus thromboides FSU 785]